jgi:hypothetical protein
MQGKGVRSLESASERERVVFWYSTHRNAGKGLGSQESAQTAACLYFYNIISNYSLLKFLDSLMKDGKHPTSESKCTYHFVA